MLKKTIKAVKEVKSAPPEVKREVLETISVDTGREDLNAVIAKLNEVIQFLNK